MDCHTSPSTTEIVAAGGPASMSAQCRGPLDKSEGVAHPPMERKSHTGLDVDSLSETGTKTRAGHATSFAINQIK